MNGNNPPDGRGGSTSPTPSRLRLAERAEAEAPMRSPYARSLGPDPRGLPFSGASAGAGAAANADPFPFRREMLRRAEAERLASGGGGRLGEGRDAEPERSSRREREPIGIRSARATEAEAAWSIGDGLVPAGAGGGDGAEARRRRPRGPPAPGGAPRPPAGLSADDRDRLGEAADRAYRAALEARGLSADRRSALPGCEDLAREAELRDGVQRRLMEREAEAERRAALERSEAAQAAALERAELYRRQQQDELFRFIQMQQFQLPGEEFGMHCAMGVANVGVMNPYAAYASAAVPQAPPFHPGFPTIDPRAAAANIERAYAAEGTPENDVIAKFLNVVTSRVPELMDLLAYYFPVGLVDNAEKFHAEFPKVVDATLAELTMMQDRASKENGYKSRGLYDRVTNCIAAIQPYRNEGTASLTAAVAQSTKQEGPSNTLSDANKKPAAKPSAKARGSPKAKAANPAEAAGPNRTWTCHKCGNDNMASKARCSACQGWKGGVRENKPKKRKPSDDEKAAKKEKKKKKKADEEEKDSKKMDKSHAEESPTKPKHVLLKTKPLPTKNDRKPSGSSDAEMNGETKNGETNESTKPAAINEEPDEKEGKKEPNKKKDDEEPKEKTKCENGGVDHMDAANVLLGLMGGGSTNSERSESPTDDARAAF